MAVMQFAGGLPAAHLILFHGARASLGELGRHVWPFEATAHVVRPDDRGLNLELAPMPQRFAGQE
ncbi:MAG: hypothetical protein U0263_17310 [Polyangiaceae bacterium]